MIVPMMNVGVMRMTVPQRGMPVRMGVRLGSVPLEIVAVHVVIIMRMLVRVFQWLMRVVVIMMLCEMQPDARSHQSHGNPEGGSWCFFKD